MDYSTHPLNKSSLCQKIFKVLKLNTIQNECMNYYFVISTSQKKSFDCYLQSFIYFLETLDMSSIAL